MKKYFIILALIMLYVPEMYAQQDAQYTQYMYNTLAVNPAYAGSRGVLSGVALHRSQWMGLNGAPRTQTLSAHSPVSKKVGLGLSIVNDQIGERTSQETNVDAVFSYVLPTSDVGKLYLGIKAGGHLLNVDYAELSGFSLEQSLAGLADVNRKFSPNFGAGVYYRSDDFYMGLSVPNFLETDHFDASGTTSSYIARERINYYLISGYVFNVNPSVKFKPAILLKAVSGVPLQTDLSANLLLNDKFTLGIAYRWDAAFSGLFGFQISDRLLLGLTYDRETTQLGSLAFNDGSFEALLRYEFKEKKCNCSRFF